MIRKVLLLLALTISATVASAARDTSTAIFSPRFRTLKVENPDNFMAPPCIVLGSDDRLTLSFDEIADDASMLRARLVHCNSDWQPSSLVDSEFVDGFNEVAVEDYAFSRATLVHYVNYLITIPSYGLTPTRSGNYLLQVFDEGDPDTILLQARFVVTEQAVSLSGMATSRTDRGYNSEWIALELEVDAPLPEIRNLYSDILVTVTPDGNDAETVSLPNPQRVEGHRLYFAHLPQLTFPAGKEWRRFETVRADHPGLHTDSVRIAGNLYNAYLSPDFPRLGHAYDFDRTQYGRFMVREYNSTDSSIGADYVVVNFALDYTPQQGEAIYLDGEFASTFAFSPESLRLHPDPASGLLKAAVPLKQGSYNYRYVVKGPDGSSSPAPIDGNSYETSKEFTVTIYHRSPMERADRVLGVFTITYNR